MYHSLYLYCRYCIFTVRSQHSCMMVQYIVTCWCFDIMLRIDILRVGFFLSRGSMWWRLDVMCEVTKDIQRTIATLTNHLNNHKSHWPRGCTTAGNRRYTLCTTRKVMCTVSNVRIRYSCQNDHEFSRAEGEHCIVAKSYSLPW